MGGIVGPLAVDRWPSAAVDHAADAIRLDADDDAAWPDPIRQKINVKFMRNRLAEAERSS